MTYVIFIFILFIMKVIEKYLVKKIVITSMALFLLMLFVIIPTNNNSYIEKTKTNNNKKIFLLDKDNYVSLVFCDYKDSNIENEIKEKINILKNGINGFKGVIPQNVELIDIKIDKKKVYLNFNNEFLKIKNINKVYECLVYSLCEIKDVEKIYISVQNKMQEGMPLNKDYGINKEYDIDDFSYVNKTIVYFAKGDYYVPITKINSDKNDKINIIIKELKSSVNSLNNLVGYLTDDIELIDYEVKKNKMELIFNKYIFDDERIQYVIGSSIFANYDVNEIVAYNQDKSISISIKK